MGYSKFANRDYLPKLPVILNRESELLYETGWSCDNGLFLDTGKNRYFITDGRYITAAKEQVSETTIVVEARNLVKKARELLLRDRVKRVLLDPTGWNLFQLEQLERVVKIRKFPNYSQLKRKIKSPEELEFIRKSAKENREGFKRFLHGLEKELKKGKREVEEWNEIELAYRFKEVLTNRGRRELSFNPIVAVGENSAKPHAVPTIKKVEIGGLLLLDGGIKYRGYCSDRTRTIAFNREGVGDDKFNQQFQNGLINKIYNVVKEAQLRAIDRIKVGVEVGELDRIARQVITDAGFGDYFVHSLGHGVGLDIHELPIVNWKNREPIREGMVFTIEPGIYLPGQFGIRIEDMVIVNHRGGIEVI